MAEEFTAKFKVDISDLKKSISEATKQIREANATFKAETAGMENWSKNADGLSKKLTNLKSILSSQKSILSAYEKALEENQKAYEENGKRAEQLKQKLQELASQGVSKADAEYQKYEKALREVIREQANNEKSVADLKLKILDEKAAIGQTESQIRKYTDAQKNLDKDASSLTSTISKQERQLSELKKEYVDVVAAEGKNSDSAKALAAQITNLSGELKDNKSKMADAEKEADKLDKSVDELGDSADDAGSKFEGLGSKIVNGLKAGVAAVGAATAAVVTAATAAVGNLVKEAVSGYSEYQQLVGGVETLFGTGGKSIREYADYVGKDVEEVREEYEKLKDAETRALENAQEAYKTAGVSANEYMNTVTTFSASLINSLDGDTAKAVDYADKALRDMSDNANKMGTAMQSIQNAYQGFAKQNYTMLDNLKLGYGGNKTEMERLIADAEKLDATFVATRDENGKLAMSYADIVDAIHIVQTNMGITGTTAEEADRTIEGSMKAMRAAWENLVVGMADSSQNTGNLVSNFVETIRKMLINLIPTIKQALMGVGELVKGLAPVIINELPAFINMVLPEFIDAIFDMVDSLGEAFPDVVTSLLKLLNTSILPRLPQLIQTGIDMVFALVEGLLSPENITLLVNAAFEIVNNLIKFLTDNISKLVHVAIDIVMALANALLAPEALSSLIDGAIELVLALADAIIDNLPYLIERLPELIENIVTGIVKNLPKLAKAGVEIGKKLIELILSPERIKATYEAGGKIIKSLANGIVEYGKGMSKAFDETFRGIGGWLENDVGKPVGDFFSRMWDGTKKNAVGAWDGIKSAFSNVSTWFSDTFSKAWQKVKDVFSTGGKIFVGIKDGIVDAFKKIVNGIIDGINKVIKVPFDGINSALQKIKDINILGLKPFDWISTIAVPQIPKLATGGVLRKGQVGLLEGSGAEAVVPLERNTGWIQAVANDMLQKLQGGNSVIDNRNLSSSRTTNYTQIINAPKAPSRIEIYRQTRNLLALAEGGTL